MPRMPLTPENRSKNSYEFPKLFLEKGERARLALLDPTPQTEYVHTLRAPQILNGIVQKEMVERGGEKVQQTKYDFISRPLCLGDFDTIEAKGSDPEQCPVCETAKTNSAVSAPERRHALNVLNYALQPGGFAVREPYGVDVKVWAFADKTFNNLIDLASEWGDLRAHDLLLGPCTVKQWQRFDINVAAKAEWAATPERAELSKEVFVKNALEDLSVACGRKNAREMVLEDLHRVIERDDEATMIESGQIKPQQPPTWAVDAIEVGDIIGGDKKDPEPEKPEEGGDIDNPPTEEPKEEKKPAKDPTLMDLDDFLNLP